MARQATSMKKTRTRYSQAYKDEALALADREGGSQIQRLLFSTFHGGSSPDWAPRHSDGRYKTDCAYFDNIELIPSPGR